MIHTKSLKIQSQNSPNKSLNFSKLNKSSSIKSKGLGKGLGVTSQSFSSSIKKSNVNNLNTPKHKPIVSKVNTPLSQKSHSGSKVLSQSSLSNSHGNLHGKTKLNSKNNKANNKENRIEKKISTVPIKNVKDKVLGKNNEDSLKQSKFGRKQTLKKQNPSNYVLYSEVQTQIDHSKSKSSNYSFEKFTPRSKDKFLGQAKMIQSQTIPKISLDQFQIGRKLGKGRFGDVYMVRQSISGCIYALKLINKKQLKESQMENQLIQEIKLQMFANHPNVLKMYGFFADDTKIYLILELATNGCLFRQIRNKVYFSEDQSSLYFRQTVNAIKYLHSNCVMHRDIKPQNIINSFGVLKLCDFGWATYAPIYQRQTFCGTLDYVPPQIVIGQFYDEKVDVWCLGVLLYELCTGKAPFQSRTDQNETYDKILKVDIDFPIYLSAEVVDLISKILHRQPKQRLKLQQIQIHPWMRQFENEPGRMVSKQIWQNWNQLTKK